MSEMLTELPPDLWRRVTLSLDFWSLCQTEIAASSCNLENVEVDVWSHLCRLHFPTMYASVLAASADARARQAVAASLTTEQPRRPRGKRGGQRNSDGPGERRTPWWRNGTRGRRRMPEGEGDPEQSFDMGSGYASLEPEEPLELAPAGDNSGIGSSAAYPGNQSRVDGGACEDATNEDATVRFHFLSSSQPALHVLSEYR
eukprot:TRINITY_DN13139_c0_g1_i1.p1 TRINITY_DN13139_c0_g1~~TRINITY_DN13139_c0_g1_i1.p1  ORF type:complete len:201 (+),score=30.52 TRINITY_DN13139_c0_g1_i1:51-653(+)